MQVALGFIFPPSVNVYNDNVEQLSRSKLDPAVQDALAKQADVVGNMLQEDLSQSIYANVTVSLDYSVRGDDRRPLDLELHLADVAFVDMKISNEKLTLSDLNFARPAAGTSPSRSRIRSFSTSRPTPHGPEPKRNTESACNATVPVAYRPQQVLKPRKEILKRAPAYRRI